MSNGTDQGQLTPLKRAFLAIEELQARLLASEAARHEPIAILGMGCRFPGGVRSPDAFWQLLRDGVDAIGPIPLERWEVAAYFDADPAAPGKMVQREGGFLADVDRFDPQFFGIAPREAAAIDPQQRLMLEVAWEALERAGLAPSRLQGSATGVFVALTTNDYRDVHLTMRGLDGLDAYYASGIAHSIASGRISYVLGLHGPSLTIDTACSSSLVAVHLAVQSLRSGESDLALAGGANLMLSPENSITLSKYQMLAPDARCKFGDARADGFVRGEGAAMLVLKRLSDALADGDPIQAVIRGSAVNQDGASSGLTAPNGPAQEAVVRAALANARVAAHDVGYVEAHGTGTALGDPIELQALGAVFAGRPSDRPLLVGSVKTHLGHLEAVAGLAGLIALVLSLQHGDIPASLHFNAPNPHIPWDELPIAIPDTIRPWPKAAGRQETRDRSEGGEDQSVANRQRRIGGVSSFGFSGTNAHLVVEEAPLSDFRIQGSGLRSSGSERPLHLLTLSAKNEVALRALAADYVAYFGAQPEYALADVAFSANSGRAHFPYRLALVASDSHQAVAALSACMAGEPAAGLSSFHSEKADPPRVAFLFTGQGAQYAGMGRALYQQQPVFRAALDHCASILAEQLDRPLLDLIFASPESVGAQLLNQTAYTQPALVALEYALAALWRSWGVEPAAVIGHSVGEYTAAIVAGVMSLDDGLTLVATRGRLMQALPAGGAMAAIFVSAERVRPLVGDDLVIAAYNGPEHTVVAGPEAAVLALVDHVTTLGLRAQRLTVSHAFHSPLLDPMLDAFAAAAHHVTFSSPQLRLISNLSGAVAGAEVLTVDYWRRHAREPVRFAQGLAQLQRMGCTLCIEIGPHPTLLGIAQSVMDECIALPSLRKGRDDWQQLLESLANAYTRGLAIDWSGFDRPYLRRKLVLPTYPFQRERYWVEPQASAAASFERSELNAHPLLGPRLRSALRQLQFEQELAHGSLAYLDDHRVFGTTILPAAGFVELALAAGQQLPSAAPPSLAMNDLLIHAPLSVGKDETRSVQTIMTPENGGAQVEIFSQVEGDAVWTLHATAVVSPLNEGHAIVREGLAALRERIVEERAVDAHYAQLCRIGLDLGPGLRALHRIWQGEGEALGEVLLPESADAYVLPPALLDACLQLFAVAAPSVEESYLPIAMDALRIWGQPEAHAFAHAWLLPSTRDRSAPADTMVGAIRLFDGAGELIAEIDGLRLKRATALHRSSAIPCDDWLYEIAWHAVQSGVEAGTQSSGCRRPPSAASAEASFGRLDLAPSALRAAAEVRIAALDAELNLGHYRHLLPTLEMLATEYVVVALHDLGWRPQPGERCTSAQLASELGVVSKHHALFDRFLHMLMDDGTLRALPGGWEVVSAPRPARMHGKAELLAKVYPLAYGDLEMTRRCGEALADALRGAVDPLQLLFPGGSLATAEDLYRVSPLARAYTALLAEVVAAVVAQLPLDRSLRILEIGAGTGGATSAVLPYLPADRSFYTFTDISPLFLARAQEHFASYSFVDYRLLDIESDPIAQGFSPQGYDIVIAANVLHTTADLRRSVRHTQGLLAPGGIALLLEMTAPLRWIDISFGLTDGWWKFADRDLRSDYPLLDRRGWLALLAELGLEEPQALPDSATGLAHQQILIARNAVAGSEAGIQESGLRRRSASRDLVSATNEGAASGLLIFADQGGLANELAAQVREHGRQATVVFAGETDGQLAPDCFVLPPHDRAAMESVLRRCPDSSDVVYLWPLDAHESHDTPPGSQAMLLGGALHLAQALVAEGAGRRLWLITRGAQAVQGTAVDPAQSTIWGFARSLVLEHPELRTVCVDLDTVEKSEVGQRQSEELARLLAENARGDEMFVALRGGQRCVARLVRTPNIAPSFGTASLGAPTDDAALELVITERGSLDNLILRPAVRRAPGPGEVEIRVQAAALNFKDVLNVLGMYPGDPGQPGSECVGTVVAVGSAVTDFAVGDEVVALASGSFRSFVTIDSIMVAHRPTNLSPEAAITLPIAYLTAAFALQHLGAMRHGERVLIHAAAGGVGLAAVQLAQLVGAEIYATAGSAAKRDYLRSLGVQHVFDSRSLDFADEVRAATKGEGVDLVLNSLAGEFVPRSLALLRSGGRFLELGKHDHLSASQIAAHGDRVEYHVIDWGETARADPALISGMLRALIARASRGELPSLPLHSFPLSDATRAFRYMAQAHHIGKIVLTQPAAPQQEAALVRADASYLITGGLGGLGLLTAEWLAAQGARALALMGRSAPDDAVRRRIAALEQAGVRVLVFTGDVASPDRVAGLIARVAAELPPLHGVIHAAGTLDDGALSQQSWPRFENVLAAKVAGAWHLHTQTRQLPLDFFVLYSSAAALLGSAGQTNHAAANSFLDALAQCRRSEGLPALSINWGVWRDVGAAVTSGAVERVGAQGIGLIAPDEGLALLGRLLRSAPAQVGVMPIDWPVFLRRFGSDAPHFFAEFAQVAPQDVFAPETVPAVPTILRQLADAAPHRRITMIRDFVRASSGRVLGLPPARIDDQTPLSALGLDSLMAVELRNLLSSGLELERRLPATLVFDYPTITAISQYLAQEALAVAVLDRAEPELVLPAVASDNLAAMVDALEDLSDEEIDRLLADKQWNR
jgi:acyl transferase domain-containing protein/acyl carrier protein